MHNKGKSFYGITVNSNEKCFMHLKHKYVCKTIIMKEKKNKTTVSSQLRWNNCVTQSSPGGNQVKQFMDHSFESSVNDFCSITKIVIQKKVTFL